MTRSALKSSGIGGARFSQTSGIGISEHRGLHKALDSGCKLEGPLGWQCPGLRFRDYKPNRFPAKHDLMEWKAWHGEFYGIPLLRNHERQRHTRKWH